MLTAPNHVLHDNWDIVAAMLTAPNHVLHDNWDIVAAIAKACSGH